MSALVQLENAGIYRGGRWLVRGVDLTVERREIVTLVGPNGSGKSTTAKMILGLIEPDEGKVVRRDAVVAYVPQKIGIDRTMPMQVRRLMRLTCELTDDDLLAALERTGVRHLADSQVHDLSGGEFQRVMLARAISREPALLVLDEPIQGVDFHGETELYALIADVRSEIDCGIVMISHDLHVVMAATDRVICLNGHVCCEGTPTSVVESSAYRELFGTRAG